MASRTVDVWTCDGCGHSVEARTGIQPTFWGRVDRTSPPRSDRSTSRDFCPRCFNTITDLLPHPNVVVELRAALEATTLHLKQLAEARFETRYQGESEPCGGCFDAIAAAEALLPDRVTIRRPTTTEETT